MSRCDAKRRAPRRGWAALLRPESAAAAAVAACLALAGAALPTVARAAPVRAGNEALPAVELTDRILFMTLAADIAAQRGQPIQAIQAYLTLSRNTRDPRFARRAVEIAFAAQLQSEALEAARVWYELAPQLEGTRQILQALLVAAGKLDEVAPLAAQQLAAAPPDERGEAILVLQQQLARAPDPQEVVKLLRTLLAGEMQRAQSHLALARAWLLARDPQQALTEIELAQSLRPDDEEIAIVAAGIAYPDHGAQLGRLERFVAAHPRATTARMQLARLYVADGRQADAEREFGAIVAANPGDAQAALALALIHIEHNRLDDAEHLITDLLHARDAASSTANGGERPARSGQARWRQLAYQTLSRIAEARGDVAAAADWLDKIEDGSLRIQAQMQRGRLLAKLGRRDDMHAVFADLRQAVSDGGGTPAQLLAIDRAEAAVLMEIRAYGGALGRLQALVAEHPDDAEVWYDMAMAQEKLDRFADMESSLRRAIKLQPDMYHAYNALGYALAERNQRLGEAEELVRKALTMAPGDPYILDSMGWVQFRQGKLRDARVSLAKAFELKPEAEIGAHFGEVLWGLGERDQARRVLREAQRLDAGNETLNDTLRRLLKTNEGK